MITFARASLRFAQVVAPKDFVLARPGSLLALSAASRAYLAAAAQTAARIEEAESLGGAVSSCDREVAAMARRILDTETLAPVYPILGASCGNEAEIARTLPDSTWASDHCLVTAVLDLSA